MSTIVTYKGNTIATAKNGTKTLLTAGKYMEDDVTLTDSTIQAYVLRPDAEKIQTFTYDKKIVDDEEITWPGYTTTATVLKASQDLSPTVTIDYDNYDYYVVHRYLAIPTYSVTSKAKGRVEYFANSNVYEVCAIPANTYKALLDGTKYTSRNVASVVQSAPKLVYWSTTSAITPYATASYGPYMTVTVHGISNGVMTVKSPALSTRGHTTYFTSTYMNAVTDVRYQYVIDVYRAPKNNFDLDGWGNAQNLLHVIDCVNNNNGTLT